MPPEIQTALHALPYWENLTLAWSEKLALTLLIIVCGWIVAGWLEHTIRHTVGRLKNADRMLVGFFSSLARWGVLLVAGLAVLDRLGVQTSSILTILGAAGLAVGLALQNTLSNLAAGIMLLLFRPFRVGDTVVTPDLNAMVSTVSLFHTELITPDNVQLIVPNTLLWGVSLKNMSFYPKRRLTLTIPVPRCTNLDQAVTTIRAIIAADDRVAADPAPEVLAMRFNARDRVTELEVRAWVAPPQVDLVQSELNQAIWRDVLQVKVNAGAARPAGDSSPDPL